MIQAAPNQKVVTICKEPGNNESGKLFARLDLDAVQNAIRRMNGKRAAGFILWSILAGNQSGYQMLISNKLFSERYGISKDYYDSGVKILIEQGFMIRQHGNQYDFYEYPEGHRAKSGKLPLLESGETPQLKVGNSHNEKSETPTFKSGELPQDNNITDNRKIDNTHPQGEKVGAADFYWNGMNEAIAASKPESEIAVWKLLAMIQTQYPYFTGKRGDPKILSETWIGSFRTVNDAEITRDSMTDAFYKHVASTDGKFPPHISNIIAYLKGENPNEERPSFSQLAKNRSFKEIMGITDEED